MARPPAKRAGRIVGFLDSISRVQLVWSGVAVALPVLGSVAAAVAGIVERQPMMWVIMAAAVVLFAGLAGSYNLLRVRQVMTSMGKLRYINTMVALELVEIKPGKTKAINRHVIEHRSIDKAQVGVHLQNTAHFDISAHIESADTSIDEYTPPRAAYPKPPVIIRPGQVVTMSDEVIDMRGKLCQNLKGRLDMRIMYGAPGREKYELEFAGEVQIGLRNTGQVLGIWTGWDAETPITSR